MKKTTLAIWFIALFAAYVTYEKLNASQTVVLVSSNQGQTSSTTSQSARATSGAASPPTPPTPTPTSKPKPTGMYKDGTYIGGSADAYYGNIQVQAVIQGGKITDVRFLDYPQSHGISVYINDQAMPYLTQEAIQAQNANVDIISGATFTSQAFVQSLGSALAQAKNS